MSEFKVLAQRPLVVSINWNVDTAIALFVQEQHASDYLTAGFDPGPSYRSDSYVAVVGEIEAETADIAMLVALVHEWMTKHQHQGPIRIHCDTPPGGVPSPAGSPETWIRAAQGGRVEVTIDGRPRNASRRERRRLIRERRVEGPNSLRLLVDRQRAPGLAEELDQTCGDRVMHFEQHEADPASLRPRRPYLDALGPYIEHRFGCRNQVRRLRG